MVIVAVNRVPAGSVADGVKVAVTPTYVTTPLMTVTPFFSVNVVVLIVAGFLLTEQGYLQMLGFGC